MSSIIEDVLDASPQARRILNLFFMVDVSGSMNGKKIGAVNDAIRNTLPIVADISDNNDAEIQIAVLKFSQGCEWMSTEPQPAVGFGWTDLTAMGLTDLGYACRELGNKLSRSHGFMNSIRGYVAPVIILLSDGGPTDDFDGGLAELKENKWFEHAIKVAIAIGDDANMDVLTKFTGGDNVIKVDDIESLKQIIRIVTVTSTQIGSKGTSVTTNGVSVSKKEEVSQAIAQKVKDVPNAQLGVDPSKLSMNPSEFD